jgi:hypothetical protein
MPDAILYWNDVALDAVARDHTGREVTNPDGSKTFVSPVAEQGGPTRTSRALAIIHLAMYDAFNEIERAKNGTSFRAYLSALPKLPPPPKTASQEASVSTAAFVTLNALYSKDEEQKNSFLAAYQLFMESVTASSEDIEDGINFGQFVARMLLRERENDGSSLNIPYIQKKVSGYHRPDPFDLKQGFLTPYWGYVKPFAVEPFLSDKPPAIDDSKYLKALDEVKEIGAVNSPTRTQEQTNIGLFWGYDGAQKLGVPPRLYNQIVRVIAAKQNNSMTNKPNSVVENALLFALVNMALADAGIQCWYSKYHFNYWRPVVGIRNTGVDWRPLGAPRTNPSQGKKNFTPNFPSYPSGHATFGAAAFTIIEKFYRTSDVPFEFISEELNGENIDADGSVRPLVIRKFKNLQQAIDENAYSRFYLGIHWRFDCDTGNNDGKNIADEICKRFPT